MVLSLQWQQQAMKNTHNFWSHPLDHSRAHAVNPVTKESFFDILEVTIWGTSPNDEIPPELIHGADETGLQPGVGVWERVYGVHNKGKRVQHQQRSGNRENITILPVICTDGTCLPPVVIYKGNGYQVSWKQNNPLNVILGYSKKGYMTGEIGIEWIHQSDEQTRAKIIALRLPLKIAWSVARNKFECTTGQPVSKSNFLEVYAKAHEAIFTENMIKTAFQKTGVVRLIMQFLTTLTLFELAIC
ncbi:hypothetical protein FISHEDRAFT_59157 [Fistulina hepatica ATCC 64428]|uniref:DDE-1 domain-containing protein n=1 Tax=Fistulina hepatica ATCC 64428 TaxID=1128425 RepID=A0A0D7ABA1_9AGAR|nr:hypothetical protein FISHEDRAFT_59157 [Fistulina hepatica ATCC 64428]